MPPRHLMPCGHSSCATVESDVDGVVVRYCGICEQAACLRDCIHEVKHLAYIALGLLSEMDVRIEARDAVVAVVTALAALEDEAGR